MKKIALLTLIFSIFLLSSCQDPIFEAIMEDVVPEAATVSGRITSITRYTAAGEEYLFLAADGGLRYKPRTNSEHGAWKVFDLPFELIHYNAEANAYEGEQILTVLADAEYLYLVKKHPDEYKPMMDDKEAKKVLQDLTPWDIDE